MTWTKPSTVGKWDCSFSTTTEVNCQYLDSIPSSLRSLEPININVIVSPNVADTVINTAVLNNGGITTTNDQATVTTPIRSADLIIDKTQLPAVVTSTDTLIYYTLVITNNGPSAASNVIVTETLPAELQPYTTTNYSPSTNPTAGTSTLLQILGQSEPWQKVREKRWF